MIVGIGIDSVEINRFKEWPSYQISTLQRIFSKKEIEYCLDIPQKSMERFAARFAAREAFFKALSAYQPNHTIPFLTICQLITVKKNDNNSPNLLVKWESMTIYQSILPVNVLLSLTHTRDFATAFIILQQTT